MNLIQAERIATRECGRPGRKRIDRDRIIRMWQEGFWTQQNIAEICDCSITTVRNTLIAEGFQRIYSGSWGCVKVIERTRE